MSGLGFDGTSAAKNTGSNSGPSVLTTRFRLLTRARVTSCGLIFLIVVSLVLLSLSSLSPGVSVFGQSQPQISTGFISDRQPGKSGSKTPSTDNGDRSKLGNFWGHLFLDRSGDESGDGSGDGSGADNGWWGSASADSKEETFSGGYTLDVVPSNRTSDAISMSFSISSLEESDFREGRFLVSDSSGTKMKELTLKPLVSSPILIQVEHK